MEASQVTEKHLFVVRASINVNFVELQTEHNNTKPHAGLHRKEQVNCNHVEVVTSVDHMDEQPTRQYEVVLHH